MAIVRLIGVHLEAHTYSSLVILTTACTDAAVVQSAFCANRPCERQVQVVKALIMNELHASGEMPEAAQQCEELLSSALEDAELNETIQDVADTQRQVVHEDGHVVVLDSRVVDHWQRWVPPQPTAVPWGACSMPFMFVIPCSAITAAWCYMRLSHPVQEDHWICGCRVTETMMRHIPSN